MILTENEKSKIVLSSDYNYKFDKLTGQFFRWGKTKDDDPQYARMPEIADIEISSGKCHNNCPFCYKQNKEDGKLHNMTFHQFKVIFHKLAKTVVEVNYENEPSKIAEYNESFECFDREFTKKEIIEYTKHKLEELELDKGVTDIRVFNRGFLTQIAFGITSPEDNPDFYKIMKYAREFDVIPNYTCNGQDMNQIWAERTVALCGAVALSVLSNKEKSYDAVKMLSHLGMKQINFHIVAMESTYNKIIEIINDAKNDDRLKGLNAIVLLKYKPKGTNAGKFKPLTQEQYNNIFNLSRELGISIGFDSCSCHSYLEAIKDREDYKEMSMLAEPCESTCFSIYVNSNCEVYPCSFCENENRNDLDWTNGISLLEHGLDEIWLSHEFNQFRETLLSNERKCPMFECI